MQGNPQVSLWIHLYICFLKKKKLVLFVYIGIVHGNCLYLFPPPLPTERKERVIAIVLFTWLILNVLYINKVSGSGVIGIYASAPPADWVPPCDMQTAAIDLLVNGQVKSKGGVIYGAAMKALEQWPHEEGKKIVEGYSSSFFSFSFFLFLIYSLSCS